MLYESSIEALHSDLERWVAEGLMEPQQARRILALQQRRDREEAAAEQRAVRRDQPPRQR